MLTLPIYTEEKIPKAAQVTVAEICIKEGFDWDIEWYDGDELSPAPLVLSLGKPNDKLAESSSVIIPGPSVKQILHTPAGLENARRAIKLWKATLEGKRIDPVYYYDLVEPNPNYTGSLSGYRGKLNEYLSFASKGWSKLVVDIEVSGDIKVDQPEDTELLSVAILFERKSDPTKYDIAVWTYEALQDPYARTRLAMLLTCGVTVELFNGPFDVKWMNNLLRGELNGLKIYPASDPQLMHYALFPGATGDHNLKDLAHKLLGADEWEEGLKQYTRGSGHFERIPRTLLYAYNAGDVYYTKGVGDLLMTWLNEPKNAPAKHVYETILLPAVPLIVDIEDTENGWPIDIPLAQKLLGEHQEVLTKQLQQFRDVVGAPDTYLSAANLKQRHAWLEKGIELRPVHEFNPSSVPQVKQWLTEHDVVLPIDKKTKKPSTSDACLMEVLETTPKKKVAKFITRLQTYRHTRKMTGTYLEGPLQAQRYGSVRHRYRIPGTVTGRLSSPQHTVPRPDKDGNAPYRRIYIAGPGKVLIGVDFGQIEARVVAELCGDRQMIDDFQLGRPDFFSLLLPGAYPQRYKNYGAVDNMKRDNPIQYKMDRQSIKPIAHGANYMRQPAAMAAQLKLDIRDANRMYYSYMDRYPALRDWQEQTMAYVRGDLIDPQWGVPGLFTVYGRRFQQGVITDSTAWAIKNAAIAYKPQSTGSDITLTAAIDLRPLLRDRYQSRICGLIHDAIYALAPEDHGEQAQVLMEKTMVASALKVYQRVPFTTEGHIGKNWEEIS